MFGDSGFENFRNCRSEGDVTIFLGEDRFPHSVIGKMIALFYEEWHVARIKDGPTEGVIPGPMTLGRWVECRLDREV